jgi:quercetin dioxygenase-like cupin family protein
MSIASPMVNHIGAEDAPWVDTGGVGLKVMRVDVEAGIWVIQNRFPAGYRVQTHRHTGCVHAFTLSGRWEYAEYRIPYTAGSYVFEPANSVHTLTVPDDVEGITEVIFVMEGANLNLADDGVTVESVTDGASILVAYRHLCEVQGFTFPEQIVITG